MENSSAVGNSRVTTKGGPKLGFHPRQEGSMLVVGMRDMQAMSQTDLSHSTDSRTWVRSPFLGAGAGLGFV